MSRYFELTRQVGIRQSAFTGERRKHDSAHAKASEIGLDAVHQSASFSAEILDLVQRIFLIPAENAPHVVVFAAVDEHRDVSNLCISVAETLARVSRRRVCLVEANFRIRESHRKPMFITRRGLADALAEDESVAGLCEPMAQENLSLLTSGAIHDNSPSLITPERVRNRFAELRDSFDFVIVSGAPVGPHAETIILSRMADGLALVLETGSTRREEAAAAIANMRALNIPVVAAVLNSAPSPRSKRFLR